MLPIRKVVLYKHGVGYFEREGSVEGDASVELSFRAGEMNDVLKSLIALDLDGGLVASVSYQAQEPLEQLLRDVGVSVPAEDVLTGLLAEVKGAAVELTVGSRTVTGAVAGVQGLPRAEGETAIVVPHVVLLAGNESLQPFDLREVKAVRLLDEALRRDLQHVLDVLLGSKRKDLKRVAIQARGQGRRRMVAAYLVETPVWKTSYRVLLEKDKQPLVQGWAIVDNTQEEDWTDVSLTLTAGLPVSFVHDLYTPRRQRRPVLEVRREEAYAPPELEASFEPSPEPAPVAASAGHRRLRAKAMAAPAMAMMAGMPAPPPPPALSEAMADSAPVATRTVEAGDLFQYEIRNPVTVRRHESALVPILLERFDGERAAVYNPEVRQKNPLSAIRFKNTTGLTLEGGPVTVLEDGRYVGEAMLDTMKAGEERLVPYSVDLGVVVTRQVEQGTGEACELLIGGGVLELRRYRVRRTAYVFDNRNPRPLAVYLDHRFEPGAELVDTPEPAERTESFLRFRVELEDRRSRRFVVSERALVAERHEVRRLTARDRAHFAAAGWLDEATATALSALEEKAQRIDSLARELEAREAEKAALVADQARLGQNLQALGASSAEAALRERYVARLGESEDRLGQIQREAQELRARREALEAELERDLAGLRSRRTLA